MRTGGLLRQVILKLLQLAGMYIFLNPVTGQEFSRKSDLTVEINGSKRLQQIHGFGVNAN